MTHILWDDQFKHTNILFSKFIDHCQISLAREEYLKYRGNHTGIYVKKEAFQKADKCQIAKVIDQIQRYGTNEENHDDDLPWDELVSILKSWEGNVGILGCYELCDMRNNEIEFRIYPISYYDPKMGNRRNAEKDAQNKVSSHILTML